MNPFQEYLWKPRTFAPLTEEDFKRKRPSTPDNDSPSEDDGVDHNGHYQLLRALDRAGRRSRLPKAAVPKNFNGKLQVHQREALGALMQSRNLILADDMGLGKTAVLLAALVQMKMWMAPLRDEPRPQTLIVLPAGLVWNWQVEVEKFVRPGFLKIVWGHESARNGMKFVHVTSERLEEMDCLVISRESLVQEYKVFQAGESEDGEEQVLSASDLAIQARGPVIYSREWTRVVLDEAHAFTTFGTFLCRAALELRREGLWGLTGTPIRNSLSEILMYYTLMRLRGFGTHFADSLLPSARRDHSISADDFEKLKIIHALLSLHMVRRRKTDILDNFPKCHIRVHTHELDKETVDVMSNLLEGCDVDGDGPEEFDIDEELGGDGDCEDGEPLNHRTILVKLRLAVIHPKLVMKTGQKSNEVPKYFEGPEGPTQRQNESQATERIRCSKKKWGKRKKLFAEGAAGFRVNESARLNEACRLVLAYHEETKYSSRTIIFAPWVRALELMRYRLRMEPQYHEDSGSLEILQIDSQTLYDQRERKEVLHAFAASPPGSVLLASIAAMQGGFNVVCASHILILTETWTPINEQQAIARAWRMGQTRDVIVDVIRSPGYIHDKLEQVRNKKCIYQRAVIDGAQHLEDMIGHHPTRTEESDETNPIYPRFCPDHQDPDRQYLRELAARKAGEYKDIQKSKEPANKKAKCVSAGNSST